MIEGIIKKTTDRFGGVVYVPEFLREGSAVCDFMYPERVVVGTNEETASGVMFELESGLATLIILNAGGWTLLTGINLMLFSLLHNPCSTTIYTIYKETGSIKWTTISTLLPVVMGIVITFFTAQIWRLFAGG